MEYCTRQCIRRTLYAVMIGISPIVMCLLFIALARLILHFLENIVCRRQKTQHRRLRHSSSVLYRADRPTLLYTPVSFAEIQRIIHREYQSEQQNESLSTSVNNDDDLSKETNFMKSILTRNEPPTSTDTLANLVVRRNEINSTPFTALFAPISRSVTPTVDNINEQKVRRPSLITIKRESVETTTLATINNNNNNNNSTIFSISDSPEFDSTDIDSSPSLSRTMKTTTTTTTVVVEEFLDFHSVNSVPCSLNLGN